MKIKRWLGVLFGLLLSVAAIAQDLPPKPNPPRLVNDLVGMLSGAERETLERKLVAFNDSTSNQITIAIIKSTGDYPPGDYAFALGRAWGVGQQGKNNGVVILWATGDRKLFIAPGYGLEGALPDAICKRIISNTLAPNFKQEQYFAGLDQATDEIIRRASGEFKADEATHDEKFPVGLIVFVLVIVVIFIYLASRRGGGGGGARSRSGGGFFPPFVTFGGWGSSSGGGSWGGGGGGGGFGGFGGGSFGGGGAGGDY